MGKYSNLRKELTKLTAEPTYQEKLNIVKAQTQTKLFEMLGRRAQPTDFGSVLIGARVMKQHLEEQIKEQNMIITAMEQELVDFLDSSDLISVRMGNGVTLTIKDDVYSQTTDKVTFHQWIRDSGLEDLFSVHYQTMNAMVKEKLLAGEDPPPGITPYFKQSIMVRGMKDLEIKEEK